jgi:hypothetical protein
VHELPYGYLGDVDDPPADRAAAVEALAAAAGIDDASLRDSLVAQLTELEALIDGSATYRASETDESFEKWATSRGRPYT